jgi:sugar phosphate isomerase/epimerase
MRVGSAHLTYCTNIHPGETWEEVRANLEHHTLRVRARYPAERPFGLGLRLSDQAARSLEHPAALEELRDFLGRHNLYVFTINGFPFGRFHGVRVKEDVYRPDWLEAERLAYSDRLARLLAQLLPPGVDGSVSTVPGAWKPRLGANGKDEVADRLLAHVATLVRLREESGRTVALALEPEPGCLLETVDETVRFFEHSLIGSSAVARFAARTGLARPAAEDSLRRHLGVCLDACHAAVEFEDAGSAVARLRAAGVGIFKVQLSAGLRVPSPVGERRQALRRFAEDVYLHQVVVRRASALTRFDDLPEALATSPDGDEWRVHFHVPLFRETLGPFENTQAFLRDLLARHARDPVSAHLEVETYTWDVLPEEFRREDVADAVARELDWVRERLPA